MNKKIIFNNLNDSFPNAWKNLTTMHSGLHKLITLIDNNLYPSMRCDNLNHIEVEKFKDQFAEVLSNIDIISDNLCIDPVELTRLKKTKIIDRLI
jgi:hypothetical protein